MTCSRCLQVRVLAAMEARGVAVSCDVLQALRMLILAQAKQLGEKAEKLAGRPFEINSPQQVRPCVMHTTSCSVLVAACYAVCICGPSHFGDM